MYGLGDVERARQLYRDAEAQFRAGRYLQAANGFVAAHLEEPDHPNPLWSAAQSYERAGQRDMAIRYYEMYATRVARFTGTPRPDYTAAQARAAVARLRGEAPAAPGEGVVDEVWSWITGGAEEPPAPGQPPGVSPSGKGFIGQTVDSIATAFGAGAGKVATDTARQTAALEQEVQPGARAPVVEMPEGGRVALPSWFPYAMIAAVGLGGVALVAYFMKQKSEEE
jgi:hypothetical protein